MEGLVKAGLGINPSDYYKLPHQNKLNGQEIKDLLFGHTTTGYTPWFGLQESNYSKDGKAVIKSTPENMLPLKGKTWIEGNTICYLYEGLYNGLKYCSDIYKNPEGGTENLNEYFEFSDIRITPFSIKK